MSWKMQHREGVLFSKEVRHNDTQWDRIGLMGDHVVENAHTVRTNHHVGPFSETRTWPHVTMDVNFPTGREDLSEKLSIALKGFVDAFLEEHQLSAGYVVEKMPAPAPSADFVVQTLTDLHEWAKEIEVYPNGLLAQVEAAVSGQHAPAPSGPMVPLRLAEELIAASHAACSLPHTSREYQRRYEAEMAIRKAVKP